MVAAKSATSLVEKLAKGAVTAYVNDLVYEVVERALGGGRKVEGRGQVEGRGEQDIQLQLSSQV